MNDDPMRPMNRRQLFQAGAAIGVGAALSTLSTSVRASDTTPHRPTQQNKIDPDMYALLSKAYFQFEHDACLRAAVLFGHGDHFCQGIDVQAFAAVIGAGADQAAKPGTIEPWGKSKPRLSKPVVVAAHGNTWNVGHELFLAISGSQQQTPALRRRKTSMRACRPAAPRFVSCAKQAGARRCAIC